MDRRAFLQQSVVGAAAAPALGAARGGHAPRREPLANEYTVLWKASDPAAEIGYCPALARLPGGRLPSSGGADASWPESVSRSLPRNAST